MGAEGCDSYQDKTGMVKDIVKEVDYVVASTRNMQKFNGL